MGIYDRDYYRAAPSERGLLDVRHWSVNVWLIVLNVLAFLLDGFLRGNPEFGEYYYNPGPLTRGGYFSLDTAIYDFQIWRVLTFQFLHADAWHLLSNMIGLAFFGHVVESHFGRRRYLAFYLTCGVAGALSYVLLYAAGVLVGDPAVPMVGASAGVFGVLVAAAYIAPDVTINLLFPPIPMKLAHLAILMMAVAAFTVLRRGPNAGGEAAHLGGGLLGLAFMMNQHWLNPFAPRRRRRPGPAAAARPRGPTARRGRKRVMFKDWSKDMNR